MALFYYYANKTRGIASEEEPSMNRARYRSMLVAALPFLVAAVADLTAYVVLRDRLPDPMASHFTARGHSDETASQTSYLVLVVVMHLGLAVLWALMALTTAGPTARRPHWLNTLGCAAAGLIGYLLIAVLFVNADAGDPVRVRMPLWQVAIGAGAGALAALVGRLLPTAFPRPAPAQPSEPGDSTRLDLAEGEAAGWTRRAPSPVLYVVGAVLLAVGVVLLFTGAPAYAVGALPGGLLCLAFSRPYVTVDRHGLTARPTALPWPRIRIPLSDIDRAMSRNIEIWDEYGGWGYRFRPGQSGLMLRSGEAIVVRRADGREFAVTVDDSATAAALLNTLAERAGVGG
ncbi:DUF1648 domain-containing protein [Streptomyces sp. NPDC048416]|uniref:DUF1648 domain-containing protein n=1 Tax=Streptomyces sp. NPDC048416 TaxID=3365546 RepID=UPI0037218D89